LREVVAECGGKGAFLAHFAGKLGVNRALLSERAASGIVRVLLFIRTCSVLEFVAGKEKKSKRENQIWMVAIQTENAPQEVRNGSVCVNRVCKES